MGIGNCTRTTRKISAVWTSLPLMGIGNAAPCLSPAPCRCLITPHGDWKLSGSLVRFRRRGPHYPSWGLETRKGPAEGWSDQASLPLMGIGNMAFRNAELYGTDFSLPLMGIGNQAHHPRYASADQLITPHGDWKPEHPSLRASIAACSLPLMGIGNMRMTGTHWPPLNDSLPLMGIGNTRRAHPSGTRTAAHYPSWGLETADGDAHAAGPAQLITPHGDWKRAVVMAGDVRQVALITPHGDWKPQGHVSSGHATLDSLPLMGIGNTGANGGLGALDILITPHGDWKPRTAKACMSTPLSHYPSWGLETCRAELDKRFLVYISLPLMGIGNPQQALLHARRLDLITPHGDWKPATMTS